VRRGSAQAAPLAAPCSQSTSVGPSSAVREESIDLRQSNEHIHRRKRPRVNAGITCALLWPHLVDPPPTRFRPSQSSAAAPPLLERAAAVLARLDRERAEADEAAEAAVRGGYGELAEAVDAATSLTSEAQRLVRDAAAFGEAAKAPGQNLARAHAAARDAQAQADGLRAAEQGVASALAALRAAAEADAAAASGDLEAALDRLATGPSGGVDDRSAETLDALPAQLAQAVGVAVAAVEGRCTDAALATVDQWLLTERGAASDRGRLLLRRAHVAAAAGAARRAAAARAARRAARGRPSPDLGALSPAAPVDDAASTSGRAGEFDNGTGFESGGAGEPDLSTLVRCRRVLARLGRLSSLRSRWGAARSAQLAADLGPGGALRPWMGPATAAADPTARAARAFLSGGATPWLRRLVGALSVDAAAAARTDLWADETAGEVDSSPLPSSSYPSSGYESLVRRGVSDAARLASGSLALALRDPSQAYADPDDGDGAPRGVGAALAIKEALVGAAAALDSLGIDSGPILDAVSGVGPRLLDAAVADTAAAVKRALMAVDSASPPYPPPLSARLGLAPPCATGRPWPPGTAEAAAAAVAAAADAAAAWMRGLADPAEGAAVASAFAVRIRDEALVAPLVAVANSAAKADDVLQGARLCLVAAALGGAWSAAARRLPRATARGGIDDDALADAALKAVTVSGAGAAAAAQLAGPIVRIMTDAAVSRTGALLQDVVSRRGWLSGAAATGPDAKARAARAEAALLDHVGRVASAAADAVSVVRRGGSDSWAHRASVAAAVTDAVSACLGRVGVGLLAALAPWTAAAAWATTGAEMVGVAGMPGGDGGGTAVEGGHTAAGAAACLGLAVATRAAAASRLAEPPGAAALALAEAVCLLTARGTGVDTSDDTAAVAAIERAASVAARVVPGWGNGEAERRAAAALQGYREPQVPGWFSAVPPVTEGPKAAPKTRIKAAAAHLEARSAALRGG